MARTYEYQQIEARVVYLYAVGLGVAAAIAWVVWGAPVSSPVFSLGGLYLLVARAPFMSLITRLGEDELSVQFWLGWPRRSIPVDAIRSAMKVQNPSWSARGGPHRIWADGLWSYSVWGTDAVEIRFEDKDGSMKAFRIGTDDVDGLFAAIDRRLGG